MKRKRFKKLLMSVGDFSRNDAEIMANMINGHRREEVIRDILTSAHLCSVYTPHEIMEYMELALSWRVDSHDRMEVPHDPS